MIVVPYTLACLGRLDARVSHAMCVLQEVADSCGGLARSCSCSRLKPGHIVYGLAVLSMPHYVVRSFR